MDSLCKIRDIYRYITEFEDNFQSKYGLGFNEGMLLCSVSKQEQCSSGEIAEMLGLSNSNASKVISSVEKKGLVNRVLGKEDKRQMYFSLSETGQKFLETIQCNSISILDTLEKIRKM